MHRPHLDALLERARERGPVAVAVAYPCDSPSLEAVAAAAGAGLIDPVLVGPAARIAAAAEAAGVGLDTAALHDTEDDPAAAAAACAALARHGRVQALMKGSLHSDELLAAAVGRDAGLRTARRASHVFVIDVPGMDRPLLFTDCVVNIAPDLMAKRDIAQNAIDLAHALGMARPKVGILSAVETVNPAIPGTLDAAALCKMADRGQITGGLVDGPLAFDNAVSPEAAQVKGIRSAVGGQADVLVVPDLESGNMLAKQLEFLGGAESAGIVMGARVPIVLTSRSDSRTTRLASCAIALMLAERRRAAPP